MTPSPIDRSAVVASAAAHDLNDELTVILSALQLLLRNEPQGERYGLLLDAMAACQRSVWKVAGVLAFNHRRGTRAPAEPMEKLVDLYESRLQ